MIVTKIITKKNVHFSCNLILYHEKFYKRLLFTIWLLLQNSWHKVITTPEHNTLASPGLKLQSLDLEPSALISTPLHFHTLPKVMTINTKCFIDTTNCYIARNVCGWDKTNPMFWLVTSAGKMGPSCPLRIGCIDPIHKKNLIRTYGCNSWTISVMKMQKVAEDQDS